MKINEAVFILASGPSMTQEDADKVSEYYTIAVNSTWKLAPWCDVLFAGDMRWWKSYGHEVDIPAKRISNAKTAERLYDAKAMKRSDAATAGHNSGQMAIIWALQAGAPEIYLLGFDCSVRHGIHHHGEHDKTPNPNQTRCNNWKSQFARINKFYPQAKIYNCSRYTELDCFPKITLEDALEGLSESPLYRAGAAAGV